MKNTIFITLLLAVFSLQLSAQKGFEEKCINYKDNKIDYEKYASAIGVQNQSLGYTSFASGHQCKASADFSSAFGFLSIASGERSFAAGLNSYAFAPSSFTFGNFIKALASNTIILGTGFGDEQQEYLVNNTPNSLMIGFKSTKPTFFVSPSSGGANKTG